MVQDTLNFSRQASREALAAVQTSGLVGKRQKQVYEFVFENGPCTAESISTVIEGGWKRLSELESMGLVRQVDRKGFGKSRTRVVRWDVTESTNPIPLVKPVGAGDARRLKVLLQELVTPTNHPAFDADHDSALMSARDRIKEINDLINAELDPE
jgi:hypothetical protein